MMPEKTKPNENKQPKQDEKNYVEKPAIDDKDVWSKDQQEKSYYYDDSYGYEVYNPDAVEDDEDDK